MMGHSIKREGRVGLEIEPARRTAMMIDHTTLEQLVRDIFTAAGSHHHEAERIAHYLVEANLVGHDSHGVIQVARYVERVRAGLLVPNQTVEIVSENEVLAVLDGRLGFGQVIGEEAMRIALDKCARFGLSLVALRNAGHLGRIGDWAEMAAREGKVAILYVNTSGGGILVAPHGGTERRLSANPIAAGVPVPGGRRSSSTSRPAPSPRGRSGLRPAKAH